MNAQQPGGSRPGPVASRFAVLRLAGAVTFRIRLLVGTLMLFNVGFYMVLPFLAVHLTDGLGAGAAVVGTVLGLRMLSQQGLFVVGGAIADAVGARSAILGGILLRVASFILLGTADDLTGATVGVVLLGLAGALFTPAIDALVAHEAEETAEATGVSRTEVFALYSVGSQAGTLVGPALGSLLVLGGFHVSCLVAAGLFAAMFVAHYRWLPRRTPGVERPEPDWGHVLGNRSFLLFALASAGYLAVYNQLYLAVPLQLARGTGSGAGAGWVFTGCAVLVLLAQVPVTVWARRHRLDHTMALGFAMIGAGAGAAAWGASEGTPGASWVAVTAFAGLLTGGQMLLLPATRDAIARLAGERMLATHYGVASTIGGGAVLVVSAAVGVAFDATASPADPGPATALPWTVLLVVALAAGAATTAVVRRTLPTRPESENTRPLNQEEKA